MKRLMKAVIVIFTTSLCSVASPAYASDDECDPDTEACFNDSLEEIIASRINDTIGTALVLGVVVYFIIDDIEDSENRTRILVDYASGKGLRLTGYDQALNVSLLPHQKSFQTNNDHLVIQQLAFEPVRFQLINISYEW